MKAYRLIAPALVALPFVPFACGTQSTNEGSSGNTSGTSSDVSSQGTSPGSSAVSGSSATSSGGASSEDNDGGASSEDNDGGASSEDNDGGASSSATSGATDASTADGIGDDEESTACGAGDPKLPAEPSFPPACATLQATQSVAANGVPSESNLDTSTIQSALDACTSGQAVKLTASATNDSFVTGPLTLPTGVSLWVDAGTTLFGTRDPNVYGSASALITVKGAGSAIVGDGVIDGQGGEPQIGATQTWWDVNGGGGESPALILASGASNFTMYKITLHNAPMFHVKVDAAGFVIWGITIKTPSKAVNSAGTALSPSSAHNTDGIDPGESASNGYIVCNDVSDGDDHIAIKGGTSVTNLTIAHNHFLAGHGMSIGSETNGGVSGVDVYDLSIDGTNSGLGGGSSNGIRIKSDSSRGGRVTDVTYSDVCVRDLANPIILTPRYSSDTGTEIPEYTGITIQNFHSLASSVTPSVTLEGYDADHLLGIALDDVVVDGISASNVTAEYANVTLGPGAVDFTPSGTSVTVTNAMSGASTPNPCTGKWVTF